MSRSGYSDDCEHLELYRASVDRAIGGQRGQAFLRELAAAMDAMPVKELIAEQLIDDDGQVCAIGVVCRARGLDVSKVDDTCPDVVGKLVGIARCMAAEIAFVNDDEWNWSDESPDNRWRRVRKWVESKIVIQ